MVQRIQLRRGTAAQWTTANPVLAVGEPGVETSPAPEDPERVKIGDGVTAWNSLPYFDDGGGGGVASVELTGNQTAAGDKTWSGRALFPTQGPLIPSATGQSAGLHESIRLAHGSMLTTTNKTGKVVNLVGSGLLADGTMPYTNGWLALGDESFDYIHCQSKLDLGGNWIIDAPIIGTTEALQSPRFVVGVPSAVAGYDALTVGIATMKDGGGFSVTDIIDRLVFNSGQTVANSKATFKNLGRVEYLSDTMEVRYGALADAGWVRFAGGLKIIHPGGGLYCNIFQDEGAAGTYFEFAAGKLFVQPRGGSPGMTLAVPLLTAASVAGNANLRVPHGTAPTSPVDGDVWTTTAGMYSRINGATVGPFGSGGSMPLTGTQTTTTRKTVFELQPSTGGVGSFSAGSVGTVFSGTTDYVFDIGYNARKSVAAEPSWTWTVEHDFNEGGFHWLEPYNEYLGAKGTSGTVTTKALTSNVATITTAAAHGLVTGDGVKVNIGDIVFDGNWTVASAPTSTTFTYARTAANVSSTAASGTISFVSYRPIFFGIGRVNGELIRSQYLAGSAGFSIRDWATNGEFANIATNGAQFNTNELVVRSVTDPPQFRFESAGAADHFSIQAAAAYLTKFAVSGNDVMLLEYGGSQGAHVSIGTDQFGSSALAVKLTGTSLASFELANIRLIKATGQLGPFMEWYDTNNTTIWGRISKNGYYETRKNTAPADADLVAGAMMIWFDSTNGAAKLMVKAKQADGTVRTGSLSLT